MTTKQNIILFVSLLLIVLVVFAFLLDRPCPTKIFTGAFLSDHPTASDIDNFRKVFGKKPYLVLVFVDWEKFVDPVVVRDVYDKGSVLFVSWEPWIALTKDGIDYQGLISGKYDDYIDKFADSLKAVNGSVFIRFAHEPNGDWYPWSGKKIGARAYIDMYRHIKRIFDNNSVKNVRWVYSINWEDIPAKGNSFMLYYPGDEYVDYVGIDGYNWGRTKEWSRWTEFNEIFLKRYGEVVEYTGKPVIISEFSSASSGGSKAGWVENAFADMKKMKRVFGFVLFNVDKETDWSFSGRDRESLSLRKSLASPCFRDAL